MGDLSPSVPIGIVPYHEIRWDPITYSNQSGGSGDVRTKIPEDTTFEDDKVQLMFIHVFYYILPPRQSCCLSCFVFLSMGLTKESCCVQEPLSLWIVDGVRVEGLILGLSLLIR